MLGVLVCCTDLFESILAMGIFIKGERSGVPQDPALMWEFAMDCASLGLVQGGWCRIKVGRSCVK